MALVEFNFEGRELNIQCTLDEKFKEIIKRFTLKLGEKKEDLYFIYGGGTLKENLTFNEQANENDKERKKISILVNKKIENDLEEESLKKSKYIICPECKECARIIVDNYKIGFYDCKNNHKINNILINNFENSQNINEAKIKCQICNQVNKSSSYQNIFFICLDCKKNLCQICKTTHDKNHNIINYDEKFCTCYFHYEPYYSYCINCKKDLCVTCETEHEGHKIVSYGSILPRIKKIQEETNNFNNKKEEFKKDIRNIINKLNFIINSMDNYSGIYEDIINNYDNKKRNYFLIQNIHDMMKYNNVEDINKIINEKNILKKINDMIDIYHKFNISNKIESNSYNESLNFEIIENNINSKKNNKDNDKKSHYEKNQINNEDIYKKNQIIEINEELMNKSENKEDNNYKDFNVSKIKKILTLKTEIYNIDQIFALKDGRILLSGENCDKKNHFFYVFDLKKDFILDLKDLKLDYYIIPDIIQMDDGIIIIKGRQSCSEIMLLVNIEEKAFEIIQSYKYIYDKIFKLSNKELLSIDSGCEKIKTYIYEDKKLKLENEKELKSTKKIWNHLNKEDICIINEKELSIYYNEKGLFSDSKYIGFFDIDKDKKIQSFKYYVDAFGLINKDLFIFSRFNILYPIHLKNHSKKKEYYIDNGGKIDSIFPLNEKHFIVANNYFIYQFELENNNKFKMIHNIELINYNLLKYPKNRLLFTESDNVEDGFQRIHLYC